MPTTTQFLEAILPSEGLRCAFVLPAKKHHWFDSNEALAAFLLEQDAKGSTVYHACATYRQPTKRNTANVLAVRSFWLDVDAGDGKSYADATEAAEAVVKFCFDTGLPLPMFVGSGRGVHVYWPLDHSVTLEEWKPHADGLKILTRQAGLQAGAERTSDAASILRPPGTHHRKASPVPVRCGPLAGPFALGNFAAVRAAYSPPGSGDNRRLRSGGVAPVSIPRHTGLNAAVADVYEPTYADPIADQCAQVAAVRDRHGNTPEPQWYGVLGVLAFCDDGEAKAHEWSAGHPNYSHPETAARLERARRLSGATTCQHFADSVDFDTCRVCPFYGQLKSPISLGRREWTGVNIWVSIFLVANGIALAALGIGLALP